MPKGYAPVSEQPEGYKKSRAPKRDEHSPRRPRHAGQKRVCQCCYRGSYEIYDFVCKRCLKDRNDLAKLEQEIAAVYPATSRLTSPEIFRKVWNQNLAMKKKIAELKLELNRKTKP